MLNESLGNILNELRNSVGLYAKCQLYGILIKREGINFEINGVTGILSLLPLFDFISHHDFLHSIAYFYHFSVRDHLTSLYQQAGSLRFWMVVRYCSSLLNHTVDSISPFITGVLVKGKQVLNIYKLRFFNF